MFRFFVITAVFILSESLYAQQIVHRVSPAAIRNLEKVREAMNLLDWEKAKSLSDKLVKLYPEWTESWKISAEVNMRAGETAVSEKALKRLVELDSAGFPEAYRWIAEWMFNRGEYADAAMNFDHYLELIQDTSGLPSRVKILNSSIRFALSQMEYSADKLPEKLKGDINTVDDEYFPSLSVDGSALVFTRQIRETPDNSKMVSREDLYYTLYQDTAYAPPEAFPYPINTGRNEGTQSLSQDGRIMFFTACNRSDTKGGCDIYFCIKSGDKWSDPVNLDYPVNSRYWDSTPFLGQDGKQLFFASNRPGGSGGMDIWQSTLQPDRSWSPPRNLGSMVNTALDEMSPIMLVDGKTFFFASNGHIGMGGFDLYQCDLTNPYKSSLPVNLGYGINTCFDEDALTINAGSNFGLFASNRDTSAGKDIYETDMSRYIPVNTTLTLTGTVRDRTTGLPVGARIEVKPHGDSLISRVEADPLTGEYLLGIPERISYRIGATCPGYLPYSHFYMNDTTGNKNKLHFSIDLEPILTGASIVLQNIFFALDSYELLPESDNDLNEILNLFSQNPGIIIEISGFTDTTGSDEYNLALSQKRAESVLRYLMNHGINTGQLRARGYGSSNPIASNNNEDGRRLNRRTEMRVIRIK